jgi:hypothetical protein
MTLRFAFVAGRLHQSCRLAYRSRPPPLILATASVTAVPAVAATPGLAGLNSVGLAVRHIQGPVGRCTQVRPVPPMTVPVGQHTQARGALLSGAGRPLLHRPRRWRLQLSERLPVRLSRSHSHPGVLEMNALPRPRSKECRYDTLESWPACWLVAYHAELLRRSRARRHVCLINYLLVL